MKPSERHDLAFFFKGKQAYSIQLFDYLISEYQKLGNIGLYPTKTMVAVSNGEKRLAWITQVGKNFIHIVFPFKEPHENMCFQKVAQVPGSNQYNHHLRILFPEDINAEVKKFMKLSLKQ